MGETLERRCALAAVLPLQSSDVSGKSARCTRVCLQGVFVGVGVCWGYSLVEAWRRQTHLTLLVHGWAVNRHPTIFHHHLSTHIKTESKSTLKLTIFLMLYLLHFYSFFYFLFNWISYGLLDISISPLCSASIHLIQSTKCSSVFR